MPTAPVNLTQIADQFSNKFPVLAYEDANGSYAHVMSPWYLNASGIYISAPLDAYSIPEMSVPGRSQLLAGQVIATTTAAPLATSQSCQAVLVQNDPESNENVLVGNSTTQVIKLVPGVATTIPASDVSLIYVISEAATAQVNWMGV